MTTYHVMDGNLCSSQHDTLEEAKAEIKRMRARFQNAVNIAEQDLEDFNNDFSIGEKE